MELNLNNIPQELKNDGLFCTWRLIEGKGKVPFNPVTGYGAKSNIKNTFNSYGIVIGYLGDYALDGGLGLGLFNGFSAIDIDNCIDENGVFSDMALYIIEYMNSYTEISPSGRGIRIIFKTDVELTKDNPLYRIRDSQIGLEVYISESTNRYVTLTGNRISEDSNINHLDITPILEKYLKKESKIVPQKAMNTSIITDSDKRIEKYLKNNYSFSQLWYKTPDGSGGNESEDDMSILNHLAYVLEGNYEAIATAFENSPYFAGKDKAHTDKWLVRKDYKLTSIQNAITSYHTFKGESKKLYEYNDSGNAKLFVNTFGNNVRYNVDNKMWMIWNNYYWEHDTLLRIKTLADIVIEQMRVTASKESDPDTFKKMISNINKASNTGGKENMIKEAQHLEGIPVTNSSFDTYKEVINTKSGIINLRTGEITESNRNQMHSKFINVELKKEEPTLWLRFLSEIYANNLELVDYIQRLAGYCLTGYTSEQSLFIFHGGGSNGKSLLLETLLKVMGDYGDTTSSDMLVTQRGGGDKTEQRLAMLKGIRFAMVEETESDDRLKEATIKNLTSDYGDIQARFLFGNHFTFKPEFKLIMATNHKPNIRGTDHGIWRRIKLIPHLISIPDSRQDKMLGVKLEKELPQILWWAVEGAMKYFKDGLKEPEVISEQVEEYRSEMNIIKRWINENCELDISYVETAKKLYKDFEEYARDNNEYLMSSNLFHRKMGEDFERKRLAIGRSYGGIRLKTKTIIELMEEIPVEDNI